MKTGQLYLQITVLCKSNINVFAEIRNFSGFLTKMYQIPNESEFSTKSHDRSVR